MHIGIVSDQHESIMKDLQMWHKSAGSEGDKIEYLPETNEIRYHARYPEEALEELILGEVIDPTEIEYEIIYD